MRRRNALTAGRRHPRTTILLVLPVTVYRQLAGAWGLPPM